MKRYCPGLQVWFELKLMVESKSVLIYWQGNSIAFGKAVAIINQASILNPT